MKAKLDLNPMFAVKEKQAPAPVAPVEKALPTPVEKTVEPATVEKTLEPASSSPVKPDSQPRPKETLSLDPRKQPSEQAQQTIPAMNKRAKKDADKNTEKV